MTLMVTDKIKKYTDSAQSQQGLKQKQFNRDEQDKDLQFKKVRGCIQESHKILNVDCIPVIQFILVTLNIFTCVQLVTKKRIF